MRLSIYSFMIFVGLFPAMKAQAIPVLRHFKNTANPSVDLGAPSAQIFIQKLDPDHKKDARTFQQRYWIDTRYSKGAEPPVIYYISGEAEDSPDYWQGPVTDFAKALGAMIVSLEHRYYGQSQPFPVLSTENLKYLTAENALADLAAFERSLRTQPGFQGKWISIGGSYAGALSAFYRSRYPELVVGALASSAPVEARENFEDYDQHVTEMLGPRCAGLVQSVVHQAETALDTSTDQFESMKALFGASAIQEPLDFLGLISGIAEYAVQYGMVSSFCPPLENASATELVSAYAAVTQSFYKVFGETAYQMSGEDASSLNASDFENGVGDRQWQYQSCTEFGFFVPAYHDPRESTQSSKITLDYARQSCKKLFGLSGNVPTWKTNLSLLQPLVMNGSHILFTNGSIDPFSLLSVLPGDQFSYENPLLQLDLVQGSFHCADISTAELPGLDQARKIFLALVSEWLEK